MPNWGGTNAAVFLPPGDPDQINFVIKEPYGVAGCIIPWNYPLLLLAWKLAPALAAGNTVVIKPSEYTPLATLRLVEIAFDHLPPGVVNVVTGYGPEAGRGAGQTSRCAADRFHRFRGDRPAHRLHCRAR